MQASSAIAPAALALDAHAPGALRKALSRAEARRKWRAFALTLPLLVFLLLTLLVPIAALLKDLARLPDSSDAGALARRLNSEVPGARSMVMGAFRALPLQGTPESIRAQLIDKDARWGEAPFWRAIAKNGARWTPDYLLASVDLQRDALGRVERMPEEQRAFGGILLRTFHISFVVTVLCLLLGYPLAWWLASLPARQANVLMILVLVPFWTSILV